MQFNNLLIVNGFDPKDVLIMRHKPNEKALAKRFHQIALNQRELFHSYQSTQLVREENQLKRAKYLASFIGHQPGKALFMGLYKNKGATPLSLKQYWQSEAKQKLRELGMKGPKGGRPFILKFDLSPTKFYRDWIGRLVVGWPGGERSWSRWAYRNRLPVVAIYEGEAIEPPMPEWHEVRWDLDRIRSIGSVWRTKLSQWRAIYFILDESDGKGYVGSASGGDNLLTRWMNYTKTGHGGNKALRGRDPENFVFSILELLPIGISREQVNQQEENWKKRLSTVTHGLNR